MPLTVWALAEPQPAGDHQPEQHADQDAIGEQQRPDDVLARSVGHQTGATGDALRSTWRRNMRRM